MNNFLLDPIKLQMPIAAIPKHDLRKMILYSRSHPNEKTLKRFLTLGLWEIGQFKDLYDLLPPITLPTLNQSLELHAKVLFRLSFTDSTYVKKLLPIAISYATGLDQKKQQAILDLLKDLVESLKNVALQYYFDKLLSLAQEFTELRMRTKSTLLSSAFLSPDLAYKLKINEEVANFLKNGKSDNLWYYNDGGHFILLAECQFISEVDNRDRKNFSDEVNFCIDAVRYGNSSAKEFVGKMTPCMNLIVKNVDLQSILVGVLQKSLSVIDLSDSEQAFKVYLKESSELLSFLGQLCARLPSTSIDLQIFFYFSLLRRAKELDNRDCQPNEVKDLLRKVIDLFFQLNSQTIDTRLTTALKNTECFVFVTYFRLLSQLGLTQELIDCLKHKHHHAIYVKYFLEEVDSFLTYAEEAYSCNHTHKIIAMTMMNGLQVLKSQKKRIGKINKFEKKFIGRSLWK